MISRLKYAGHVFAVAAVLGGIVLFHSCVHRSPTARTPELAVEALKAPPVVHIGLSAYQEAQFVPIAVDGNFEITTLDGKTVVQEGSLLPLTDVSADASGLNVGSVRTGVDVIDILPAYDGTLKVANRYYRGKLRLYRTAGNRVSAVNIVDTESYLAGVIGAEMMLVWPVEALKAQAVAARSYAMWEMKRTRDSSPNRLYDMLDDASAQCYLGRERESQKAREVVEATRGVVLVFAGRLVPTFYHSTCGGHTSAAWRVGFPVPDTTPLMGVRCDYCKDSKYYNWKYTITTANMAAALQPAKKNRRAVEAITPLDADAGGRLFTVAIRLAGSEKDQTMTVRDFRRAIGPNKLRSALFTVTRRGTKFEFVGRGWGHGVGLCQYGAFKLAENGFEYIDILRYYFPGAEAVRLYR